MTKETSAVDRHVATMAHLRDPQVGDRFHEMYSAWMHVIARPGPVVVVHVLGGYGGRVRVHRTVEEFVATSVYGSESMRDKSPWTYCDNIGDKVHDYLHEEYLTETKAAPPCCPSPPWAPVDDHD